MLGECYTPRAFFIAPSDRIILQRFCLTGIQKNRHCIQKLLVLIDFRNLSGKGSLP